MNWYKDIVERCNKQHIDIEGYHIYIDNGTLDGNSCGEVTLSHDERWICIPETSFNESFDEEVFIPTCYEIKDSFTTYCKSDSMWHLVHGYILYPRRSYIHG